MHNNIQPEFDTHIKLAVYRHFAVSGAAPSVEQIAKATGGSSLEVLQSYQNLRASRVLYLEQDNQTIRMAPPFSGVGTQHMVESDGIHYYANCAWDALGIPAALGRPAVISSRCEQSQHPLVLNTATDDLAKSTWLFHCQVPAALWWDDLVYT